MYASLVVPIEKLESSSLEWSTKEDGRRWADGGDRSYIVEESSGKWRIATASEAGGLNQTGLRYDTEEEAKIVAGLLHDHNRHLDTSPRPSRWFPEGRGTTTPWGKAQTARSYMRGVTSYTTAGHGGFKVSDGVNAKIPEYLRNKDGWYEEDCDWALIVIAFRDKDTNTRVLGAEKAEALYAVFTDFEVLLAEASVRTYDPDAWEIRFGRPLLDGESSSKDRRIAMDREEKAAPAAQF